MKNISLLIIAIFTCQIYAMEEKAVDHYKLDGPTLSPHQANLSSENHDIIVFQDPTNQEYKNVYESITKCIKKISPENPESIERLAHIFTCTDVCKKINNTIDTTLLFATYEPEDDYNVFQKKFY